MTTYDILKSYLKTNNNAAVNTPAAPSASAAGQSTYEKLKAFTSVKAKTTPKSPTVNLTNYTLRQAEEAKPSTRQTYLKQISTEEGMQTSLDDLESRRKALSSEVVKLYNAGKIEEANAKAAEVRSLNNRVDALNGDFSTGKLLKGVLLKGSDEFATGITSTADWLLGKHLQSLGWEKNPISALNEHMQSAKQQNIDYFAENVESSGKVGKAIDKYGTMTVAALPQAAVAFMTAGSSLAGQATTAGLQAASAAAGSTGLATTISTAVTEMAKNPQYWLAFLQTAGNNYDEAIADGASDMKASTYAMLNGLIGSLVEVGGGGIQSLPSELKGGKSAVKAWVDTMYDEGKEEVIQGVIERLLQNVTYQKGNELFSAKNPNAVFNPLTAIEEAKGGAIVGGLLGGGQIGVNAALNKPSQPQNTVPNPLVNPTPTQEEIKIETPETMRPAQETQQISTEDEYNNKVAEQKNVISKLEAVAEQERAEYINLYAEYRSTDAETRRPELISEAAAQKNKVAVAETAVKKAQDELKQIEIQHTQETENQKAKAKAKEVDAEVVDIISDFNGRIISEDALADAEQVGGLVDEVSALRRAYNKAKRLQAREIRLTKDIDNAQSLKESIEIQAKLDNVKSQLDKASNELQNAQNAIASHIATQDSVFNSAQATQSNANPLAPKVTTPQANMPQNATQSVTEGATLPEGMGAKSANFPYIEVPTQTKAADSITTESEKQIPGLRAEDATHKLLTNEESRAQAQERMELDYEGEKAELANMEWGAAETVMAHQYLTDAIEEARQTGDFSEAVRLKKMFDQKGTEEGQALQARKQFVATPEYIMAEAAETLNGNNVRKLSPKKKGGILDTVAQQAEAYNDIAEGDVDSLIAFIKKNNEIRRTTGLLNKKTSKQMSWALDYCAKNYDGAEAFLRDVAVAQVRNIAGDYKQISKAEAFKSYRIMSMLSKVATIMRNLVSNNVLDPLDSLSNNMVVPVDILLSKITGQRSVSVDKSWLSSAKRKGSLEGALKSYIQVGLDAEVTDAVSKYEQRSGRVFKMTGSPLERLLSTWGKVEKYALQTTDEFQKGGIRAETQRGLNSLRERGLLAEDALLDRADTVARERTLQADSLAARATLGVKDAMNRFGITDKQGGSLGVGDMAIPFSVVPANLPTMAANYSTLGLANGIKNLGRTLWKAHKGTLTPEMQAKTVTDIGRGLSGVAGLAMFTALAIKGIISVAGDDNDDKEALEKAEGKTGTQFNVSALMRWINGESTERENEDYLMSIAFMEILNAQMAAGALLAEQYRNGEDIGLADVGKATLDAVVQAVLELPALQQINDLVNGYKYSGGERISEKATDAGLDYLGSQVGSFVPNFIGGIASGMDGTVRNTYTGDKWWEKAKDNVLSKIPGARETVPASLDNFGNERTYTDNPLLNALNSNILPGQITQYNTTDVSQELARLDDVTDGEVSYPDRKVPSSFSTKYSLTADEKDVFQTTQGKAAYDLINSFISSKDYADFTDAEKAAHIGNLIDYAQDLAKEELVESRGDEYNSTGFTDLATALEKDITLAEFYKAYDLYAGILKDDTLKTSQKPTEFTNALERELPGLPDSKEEELKAMLDYWSGVRQDSDRYDTMRDYGLPEAKAKTFADSIFGIVGNGTNGLVTNEQKQTAIANTKYSDADKLKAIKAYYDPKTDDSKTYAKYATANKYNISVKTYAQYKTKLKEVTGGKTVNGDYAKKAIDSMTGLTKQQKAVLYALTNTGWKTNPYISGYTGDTIKWAS